MLHSIRLAAEFPAPAATIYSMYLDAAEHAAITGAPATIAPREGADFEAFGGALTGRILHLVPGRRIVQTWRSDAFRPGDADSVLILTLLPRGRRTLLDLQQTGIPVQDYAGISHGWEAYYFAPWRKRLALLRASRAPGARARGNRSAEKPGDRSLDAHVRTLVAVTPAPPSTASRLRGAARG